MGYKDQKKLIARLSELLENMKELDRNIARATKEAFPIGQLVSYRHGEQLRFARVAGHSDWGAPRVQVQGITGKTYWITVYRILEEVEQ
jgi:hypothetical protein